MDAVTAVMATFRADYVTLGALHCITNQTYPPIRIVVLDVSKDGNLGNNTVIADYARFAPIEIYRGPDMLHAYEGRNWLAMQSKTVWTWFVDDDSFANHTCLKKLVDGAAQYEVGMVGGVKLDITRHKPWGEGDWNLMNCCRERDVQMPWCDTACCLVKTKEWIANCDGYESISGETGEDVYVTARIAEKVGCVGIHDAICYHVPMAGKESTWTEKISSSDKRVIEQLKDKVPGEHLKWLESTLLLRQQPGSVIMEDMECPAEGSGES